MVQASPSVVSPPRARLSERVKSADASLNLATKHRLGPQQTLLGDPRTSLQIDSVERFATAPLGNTAYSISSRHASTHSEVGAGFGELNTCDGNLTKTVQNSRVGQVLNDVSIAIIGCAGVGKSTFMQRALDLKSFPRSAITSKKVSLEGSISVVRLIELDVTEISIIDNALRWPKIVDGYPVLRIDGLLLLYDVLHYATFDALPAVLGNEPHPQSPDLKLRLRLVTRTDFL